MKTQKRAIINFFELSDNWQKEAIDNLGQEIAEETSYLEPNESAIPGTHILWDLSEAMRQKGNYEGFKYNSVITISNNTAMLLNVYNDGSEAEYIFI